MSLVPSTAKQISPPLTPACTCNHAQQQQCETELHEYSVATLAVLHTSGSIFSIQAEYLHNSSHQLQQHYKACSNGTANSSSLSNTTKKPQHSLYIYSLVIVALIVQCSNTGKASKSNSSSSSSGAVQQ
jgi:hypothetical protein